MLAFQKDAILELQMQVAKNDILFLNNDAIMTPGSYFFHEDEPL